MTLPKMPVTKLGDSGPDVEFIQSVLGLSVDALFDASTEAAVKDFQRSFGLPDSGIVEQDTWAKLFNLHDHLRIRPPAPPAKDNDHVA
jgi:peptidoglycan hydrolase-like protein with peptidoglycan-binding domain